MNAIQGTYADFKIVKSRNVAQFIIEVPIEQANQAVNTFGLPDPHIEKWVAIAMLNQQVVKDNEEAIKAVQQAGMLCKSEAFGNFLVSKKLDINPSDPDSIAQGLRAILGIRSRTDFHNDAEALKAFTRLKGEFDASLMLDNSSSVLDTPPVPMHSRT